METKMLNFFKKERISGFFLGYGLGFVASSLIIYTSYNDSLATLAVGLATGFGTMLASSMLGKFFGSWLSKK